VVGDTDDIFGVAFDAAAIIMDSVPDSLRGAEFGVDKVEVDVDVEVEADARVGVEKVPTIFDAVLFEVVFEVEVIVGLSQDCEGSAC
jgi:hypothetical protein